MLRPALAFVAFGIILALTVPDLSGRLTALLEPQPKELPAAPGGAARVMLAAGPNGHFETMVTVNGRQVKALIDTGASMVALTYEDGRALGLIRPGDRYDIKIQTGAGETTARRVVLNNVRVGGISVHDVEAIVTREGQLPFNLLGMSFLGKLRGFESRDGRLILEQ